MDTKLKAGLEVHQQLDTRKLFCQCPSILRQDPPDFKIQRQLHAIAGETGSIDTAVSFEAEKDKTFIYECHKDNVCLVELDESPPFEINPEALSIAIQLSLLLNCEIIQHTQIMRKTVIDGSNTSGFQRTVLIAKNGYIDTAQGRVKIDTIALEEDSARIIRNEKNTAVYRLDRLGIPLIEIATAPDLTSAEQVKETALHIGEVLRACKVKRGIGTIRQDINMSIKTSQGVSERVEVKGFQEPSMFLNVIEKEIERQRLLLEKNQSRKEVRKANDDGTTTFLRPLPGAARMYPETDLPLLHISRDLINEAKKNLPKLKAHLREELKSHGLNEELASLILKEEKLEEYKELLLVHNNPHLIAKMLILWPKDIASKEKISAEKLEQNITADAIDIILTAVKNKELNESQARDVIKEVALGKSVVDAVAEKKEKLPSTANVEEEILRIIKEKPNLTINAYMGIVMKEIRGLTGREAIEILKKLLK